MKTVRLQVALSHSGIASRRKAAAIIEEGRVLVNNKVVYKKGYPIDIEKDKIVVDGKKIGPEKKFYILLNKPRNIITSRYDPYGRKTVFDIIPREFKKLHPVGRLDKDTTGILLLTNDGELTYRLTHPKFEILKKYKVKCKGKAADKEKNRLERGIIIEGRRTSRAKVEILRSGTNTSDLFIEIYEGRKRQVKKMFLFLGHPAKRLERVSFGFLKLGSLKRGAFRYLAAAEVRRLREL